MLDLGEARSDVFRPRQCLHCFRVDTFPCIITGITQVIFLCVKHKYHSIRLWCGAQPISHCCCSSERI